MTNLTRLWKELVLRHQELLIITVQEYQELLSQDINKIEKITARKIELIKEIVVLDRNRTKLLTELDTKFNSIEDLIKHYSGTEDLARYNATLKDVVLKIKGQNLKNQYFYNKLILELKDFKRSITGQSPFKLYDMKGLER